MQLSVSISVVLVCDVFVGAKFSGFEIGRRGDVVVGGPKRRLPSATSDPRLASELITGLAESSIDKIKSILRKTQYLLGGPIDSITVKQDLLVCRRGKRQREQFRPGSWGFVRGCRTKPRLQQSSVCYPQGGVLGREMGLEMPTESRPAVVPPIFVPIPR